MKKYLIVLSALLTFGAIQVSAQSLSDLFGSLKNKTSNDTTATKTEESSQSSSGSSLLGGLGSLGGVIGGVVDELTSTKDINLDNLTGTWKYAAPAVTLDSGNALQNIGGSAVTSMVEEKLEPYYKMAGIDKMVLTVDEQHGFEMQMGFGKLNGTIEKDASGTLVFNFKAFNKIKIGKVKTMASQSVSGLTLTFDVSQLKKVVDKAATLSQNQTIQTISSLLGAYDGIYAGFRLTKGN